MDIDLTPQLRKKMASYPRKRARYNSSELYGIVNGWVTPETWMNPPERTPIEMYRMFSGTLVHDHTQRLLPAEGNEVKKEYTHRGITLVAKVDHLPRKEEDDSVWEIKTSENEMKKSKAWHDYQAKLYCTIFERPVSKVFQPVFNEQGYWLKLIGTVERDDKWFAEQIEKLMQFHFQLERLWDARENKVYGPKEFRNQIGQPIGTWNGKQFFKSVDPDEHLMKIYDAWGIDTAVLHQLPADGAIDIHDRKNDKHYVTVVSEFLTKGIPKDFGHGEQVFLPRNLFNLGAA